MNEFVGFQMCSICGANKVIGGLKVVCLLLDCRVGYLGWLGKYMGFHFVYLGMFGFAWSLQKIAPLNSRSLWALMETN